MLIRRDVLARLGGMDERFFLYCEDTDICARLRDAGFGIRFEPSAHIYHQGGASRPSSELRTVLAASRVRYARIHRGRMAARMEAIGIALSEATHVLTSLARPAVARGHFAALRWVLSNSSSELDPKTGGA
jgi:GT2 family glycosyltransferase